MANTTKVALGWDPHWKAETLRMDKQRSRYRFRLYGFDEIAHMPHDEWVKRCRKDDADAASWDAKRSRRRRQP
jgi:hypothetical protein